MIGFLTLTIILIICLILGDIFKPAYGRCRGCSGCALDTYMAADTKACKREQKRLNDLQKHGS